MKRTDLRALARTDDRRARDKARETKEELFNLRFALRTGHLSDFSKVKAARRTYAQIQTAISEKNVIARRHVMEQPSTSGPADAATSERAQSPPHQAGPRREQQDGQDDRRRDRDARAASGLHRRSSGSRGASRRTTSRTRPASAIWSASKSAARMSQRQALALARDRGAREVIQQETRLKVADN